MVKRRSNRVSRRSKRVSRRTRRSSRRRVSKRQINSRRTRRRSRRTRRRMKGGIVHKTEHKNFAFAINRVGEAAAAAKVYRKEDLERMPPLKVKAVAKQAGVPVVPMGKPARTKDESIAAILELASEAAPEAGGAGEVAGELLAGYHGADLALIRSFGDLQTELLEKVKGIEDIGRDILSLPWPIKITFIPEGAPSITVGDEADFSALVDKRNINKKGSINFSVEYDDTIYQGAG